MPVPWRIEPERRDEIDLVVAAPARAIRRRGVRSRRLRLEPDDVVAADGLRVLSASRAWCDLVDWCTVPELVAAADSLLRRGRSSAAGLAAEIAKLADRRGTPKLEAAVALLDAASESPKESELRAICTLAGLPPLSVNRDIHDRLGRFIARVDLMFEGFGEILEYQGDHHRTDQSQWRRDRTRESELESLGLHVTEVTADDVASPLTLVVRVARRLEHSGWRGELELSEWFPRAVPPVPPRRRAARRNVQTG